LADWVVDADALVDTSLGAGMFRCVSSLYAVTGENGRRPWTARIGAAAGSDAAD
jgi:hypothetical protein